MKSGPDIALSFDGVPITYEVGGSGAPALVFVHGWCCDRHYWDEQVDHFAAHYAVVTIDLGGHGASGRQRTAWTMSAFGRDVVAVVERLGLPQAVLIGHSMGGSVIVEAALRLSGQAIGVIGVDTWRQLSRARTAEEVDASLSALRSDFVPAARARVRQMFVPSSKASLVEQVVSAMSAAPPRIGVGAMEELSLNDRGLREGLGKIGALKIAINSDYQPIDEEGLRSLGIELVTMSGVGHFVMMEDSPTFNRLLDEAIGRCLRAAKAANR